MTESAIRVYVDSVPLDVQPAATVIDAVRAASDDLAQAVIEGTRMVTDSRGLPVEPDIALHGGAILRVVAVRMKDA